MCRLILATKSAVTEYEGKYGLLTLLKHLEKELGGQGNGVALIKEKKLQLLEKGVAMKVEECEKIMLERDYDYVIFHTRIASCGAVEDDRCHPYVWGNNVIAMNGTIYGISDIADAMEVTDTEVVLNIIRGLDSNKAIKVMNATEQVFVGYIEGNPIAVKGRGDLAEFKTEKKEDIFIASSFPADVEEVERLAKNFWQCGKTRHNPKPKKTAIRTTDWDYFPSYPYAKWKLPKVTQLPGESVIEKKVTTDKTEVIKEYYSYKGNGTWTENSKEWEWVDDDYCEDDLKKDEWKEGYEDGYEEGYKDGQTDGFDKGYEDGKHEGFADAMYEATGVEYTPE
jgi:hypothetical protein